MTDYRAGATVTFTGEYFNIAGPSGVLSDPSGGVTLTITYGSGGAAVAGPFVYSGATAPTSGQVYRQATGVFAFDWTIPYSAATGVYVMNWTFADGPYDTEFPAVENVSVLGGAVTPPANPDTGYWAGTLTGGGQTVAFGAVDENGVGWSLLKVEGWDSPDSVGQVSQRGGDHGGIASPQYYAPRAITLTVLASAPSQAARDEARAMMQQAAPINDLGSFVYDEPTPKQAAVRRQGKVQETCPTLFDVQFSVLLIAPDPRKYGTQTKTIISSATGPRLGITTPFATPITLPAQPPPASAVVVNEGRFETRPVVTVTGPVTGPALYNQTAGRTVSFTNLTLGAADVLTVDFQNKVADLNGSTRIPDLASAWWVLPPGETQIELQGEAAEGSQMTITYQDAWM